MRMHCMNCHCCLRQRRPLSIIRNFTFRRLTLGSTSIDNVFRVFPQAPKQDNRGTLAAVYVISNSQRNLFSIDHWHVRAVSSHIVRRWRDLFSYKSRTPKSVYLTLIPPKGSSSPLQWLLTPPFRLYNKYSVVCFLARLLLSCKISDRFLHGWPLSKQHSFRLHGITCGQMVWFLRNQSGRSSKSMIVFVCSLSLTFESFSKMITHSCRSSTSIL